MNIRRNEGRPTRDDRRFKRDMRRAYNRVDPNEESPTNSVLEELGEYDGPDQRHPVRNMGLAALLTALAGNRASTAAGTLNASGNYGVDENPGVMDVLAQMFRRQQ